MIASRTAQFVITVGAIEPTDCRLICYAMPFGIGNCITNQVLGVVIT